MNNNKILALVFVALLIGLPYWRVQDNSKYMIDGIKNHLSALGELKHADSQIGLDGKITLSRLTFIPKGHQQGFRIHHVVIHANLWDLLLKDSQTLTSMAPDNLTLSFNDITLNSNGNDLKKTLQNHHFWPAVAGGLGNLSCGQSDQGGFDDQQWLHLFPDGLSFNAEFTYNLTDAFHLDFNLNLETEASWFNTWSGTLTRASDLPRITFDDVIVDTLYYYHADQGFNQRRNDLCSKKHRNSFAAYRLDSANQLQQSLRAQVAKDLPERLSNMYQRSLAAEVELNAIIRFPEPKYISELAPLSQIELLLSSELEVALGENDYSLVEFKAIDHLDLNMELLRSQMEAQEQKAAKEAEPEKPKELIPTITHHIGGAKKKSTNLENWHNAVGKNVNIKTKRGRPIFGKLLAINDDILTVSTRYMSGDATITVSRREVLSVGLSQ